MNDKDLKTLILNADKELTANQFESLAAREDAHIIVVDGGYVKYIIYNVDTEFLKRRILLTCISRWKSTLRVRLLTSTG